jgi:MraZ protein
MNAIVGTYECKVDAKGRVSIPAALKKQLPGIADGFVLKRSIYERCVELWPMQEWLVMMDKINGLNRFVKENDVFIRKFMAGVKQVEIDDAGRLLMSKDLMEYAHISKEVVLSSKLNVIEIWDKDAYETLLDDDSIDFAELASKVMGNTNIL